MVAGICPRKLFAYIRIRLNSREEEAFEHTRSLLGMDVVRIDARGRFAFAFGREKERREMRVRLCSTRSASQEKR